MLRRTHLAIAFVGALLFVIYVPNKFIFLIAALVAALVPDIDTKHSKVGKNIAFRPVQIATRHRGIFHSFTLCLVFSVLLALAFPVAGFGFFLGYGLHLFADSFTPQGIKPFWPYKGESRGPIITGSLAENAIFVAVLIVGVFLLVKFAEGSGVF